MGEIFVEDDTLNELTVLEGTTGLGSNFDKVEVDILPLQVGDVKDGLHGEVGVVLLALADNLGSESGHGALLEVSVIILGDVELFTDIIQLFEGNIASQLESIGYLERMYTLVQELLRLI